MPSLKGLTCSIELAHTQEQLQEYGTAYNDGFVETFVAVPSKPKPFTIHLRSSEFIAPGLAMYVFMDGVYQCNRHRQDLRLQEPLDTRSLIDFRVRQKEEKQSDGDGTMIAREWIFEKLNVTSADSTPNSCSSNIIDNIGCIEVIVLRCAGTREPTSTSVQNKSSQHSQVPVSSFDGANDLPGYNFGLNGQPREWSTLSNQPKFDDRNWQTTDRFAQPLEHDRDSGRPRHPPPDYAGPQFPRRRRGSQLDLPPRSSSAYIKTVRCHPISVTGGDAHSHLNDRESSPSIIERLYTRTHRRDNRTLSPGYIGTERLSPSGFTYGSGPVPRKSKAESEAELFRDRTPDRILTEVPIVDPKWLDRLVTDAVQRELEENWQRNSSKKAPIQTSDQYNPTIPRPTPGVWPLSPFGSLEQSPSAIEDRDNDHPWRSSMMEASGPDSSRNERATGWAKQPAQMKSAYPKWGSPNAQKDATQSGALNQLHTQDDGSDSWESSTWGTKNSNTGVKRRGSILPSHWNEADITAVPSPESICSLSSHHSDKGWIKVSSQSDVSSDYWSSKSAATAVPRPEIIGEVKNSKSGLNTRLRHRKAQRNLSSNVASWSAQDGNGWSRANVQELTPSTSDTWRPIVSVNPPPQESIADRRKSRREKQEKKKLITSTLPAPTWGCAVLQKIGKYWDTPAREPPSPYGFAFENLRRNVSSSSSSYRPWLVSKTENNLLSWHDGNAAEQTPESSKQSSWANRCISSKQDFRTQDTMWAEKKIDEKWGTWGADNDDDNNANLAGWINEGWGASNPHQQPSDSRISKGTKTSDWGEDNKNLKNQAQGNDAGAFSSWNNQGGRNKSYAQESIWEKLDNDSNNEQQQAFWGRDRAFPIPSIAASHKHSTASSKHTSTSRRQRYKNIRETTDPGAKSHWKFPPSPFKKTYPVPEEYESVASNGNGKIWTIPEEPLYEIPSAKAEEKMLEHQVRAGKGTKYTHIIGRPKYMDSLEKPYAIFRFKYRSRPVLRGILGPHLVPDTSCPPSPTQPKPTLTSEHIPLGKLAALSKEEMVGRLIELNDRLKEEETGKKGTPTMVGTWITDQQARSREAGLSGKKSEAKGSVKVPSVYDLAQGRGGPVSQKGSKKAQSLKIASNNEDCGKQHGWASGGLSGADASWDATSKGRNADADGWKQSGGVVGGGSGGGSGDGGGDGGEGV